MNPSTAVLSQDPAASTETSQDLGEFIAEFGPEDVIQPENLLRHRHHSLGSCVCFTRPDVAVQSSLSNGSWSNGYGVIDGHGAGSSDKHLHFSLQVTVHIWKSAPQKITKGSAPLQCKHNQTNAKNHNICELAERPNKHLKHVHCRLKITLTRNL